MTNYRSGKNGIERQNDPSDVKVTEEALVGALLIDPQAFFDIAGLVDAEDFKYTPNRYVFEAVQAITGRGEAVDYLTVTNELESRKRLGNVGGDVYVSSLISAVPSAVHARTYAKQVAQAAHRRRLIAVAGDIAKAAYDAGMEPLDVQNLAETAIIKVRRGHGTEVTASAMSEEIYELVSEWAQNPSQIRGLPTGIDALDAMLGGIEPGLIILAARTSVGKTAVGLQMAINIAKAGKRVAIFSIEMSKQQLWLRLASSEAEVSLQKIKRGEVTRAEMEKVVNALGTLAALPILIRTGETSVGDIRAVLQREALAGEPIVFSLVDYIGLMDSSAQDSENRNLELGAISRGLLIAGQELSCSIVGIHQLSRAVEQRADKRPMLSDLRESGHLEEDADLVLGLFREGYYDKSEPDTSMEIWVLKNRLGGGAGDYAKVFWHGPWMKTKRLHL